MAPGAWAGQGATPPPLSAILQIDAITLDLIIPFSDEAQGVCDEALWTRFAQTALEFPRLRRVELRQKWNIAGVKGFRQPDFLGVTDTAFKPLMDAGKFLGRFTGDSGETVLVVTGTVSPKSRGKLAEKAIDGDGDQGNYSDSDCESDETADEANASLGAYFALRSRLADTHQHLVESGTIAHTRGDAREELIP